MKQRESVNELVKAEKGLLRVAQLNSFNKYSAYLSKYSGPIFSASIGVFILKIGQNVKEGVFFSISKLFWAEKGYFYRYQRMNIETKGIG